MHVQSYCFANLNLLLFLTIPSASLSSDIQFPIIWDYWDDPDDLDHHKETRLNPNTKPNLTLTLT